MEEEIVEPRLMGLLLRVTEKCTIHAFGPHRVQMTRTAGRDRDGMDLPITVSVMFWMNGVWYPCWSSKHGVSDWKHPDDCVAKELENVIKFCDGFPGE